MKEFLDRLSKIVYQGMCRHEFMHLSSSSFRICGKCGKIENVEG